MVKRVLVLALRGSEAPENDNPFSVVLLCDASSPNAETPPPGASASPGTVPAMAARLPAMSAATAPFTPDVTCSTDTPSGSIASPSRSGFGRFASTVTAASSCTDDASVASTVISESARGAVTRFRKALRPGAAMCTR